MKLLFTLFFLILSALSLAQAQDSIIPQDMRNYSRVQKIIFDGKEIDAGFMHHTYRAAHFVVPYDWDSFVRITYKWEEKSYLVELLDRDRIVTFSVQDGNASGEFKATVQAVKINQYEQTELGGGTYWFSHTLIGDASETTVTLVQPLMSSRSISEEITVTGKMNFNPCDGCEHGDQFMIGSVNTVKLDFGDYYIGDCEGTVHPILAQLLEELWDDETSTNVALGVPFTFKGLVNLNGSDMIEDTDSHWIADNRQGQVYIGNTTKLPLRKFLDSIIFRTAFIMNVQPNTIWEDVIQNGKFTEYKNDILIFTYQNVVIKTNLSTGESFN